MLFYKVIPNVAVDLHSWSLTNELVALTLIALLSEDKFYQVLLYSTAALSLVWPDRQYSEILGLAHFWYRIVL